MTLQKKNLVALTTKIASIIFLDHYVFIPTFTIPWYIFLGKCINYPMVQNFSPILHYTGWLIETLVVSLV